MGMLLQVSGINMDGFWGMETPAVAFSVYLRAAILAIIFAVILSLFIVYRKRAWMAEMLFLIIFLFLIIDGNSVEQSIAETYLRHQMQYNVVTLGCFSWPAFWIAPAIGLPIGIILGCVVGFLLLRLRQAQKAKSQPPNSPQ